MKMQLFVRNLCGGKTRTLKVDSDDTVYSVMAQIEDLTGVPPILQRIDYRCKNFYPDTPGTLADNKLVDLSSPDHPNCVAVNLDCGRGWHMLQRKTLTNLGFSVDGDLDFDDPSVAWLDYPGQKKMFITVTDEIRMDGGETRMGMFVTAEDTVASLMERVQRRRRYPVAMQRYMVRNAGEYSKRDMDKLDATLADYNVREDSVIQLCMSMEYAFQADRERRKVNKQAKEIAAPPATASNRSSPTTKSDPARSVYQHVVF